MTGTPRDGRPNTVALRIDRATTARPTGRPGSNARPAGGPGSRQPRSPRTISCDIAELARRAGPPGRRNCGRHRPRRTGSELLMMIVSPAPALKPTRMLSLIRLHENAELEKPGNQAKQCHRECGKARDLRVSHRVSCRQRSDGAGHHQRDRRGGTDRQLARRSEQRIAEAAEQIAVDADLGLQTGQARIGQRHRDRIGGERHAGDHIVTQPRRFICGKPGQRRKNLLQPGRSGVTSCACLVASHIAAQQDDQKSHVPAGLATHERRPIPAGIDLDQASSPRKFHEIQSRHIRTAYREMVTTMKTISWMISTAPEIFLLLAIAIGTVLGRSEFAAFRSARRRAH